MSSDPITPDTAQFIRANISSLGLLEILLLLRERHPAELTASEISGQLRSTLEAVEQRLDALLANGFVARAEQHPFHYCYAPQSAEVAAKIDVVSKLYEQYRGRVIDIIYSPRDPMQSFSDAFRFKKDPENNG